jgi:spoIIIJ-associated protein
LEEWVEVGRQLMQGLLQRLGMETEVEGSLKEGDICLDVKSDDGGILIGKHGRTLEALQIIVSRMVNKQIKKPVRVILDVADYKKRRADSLERMAGRLGENVKKTGREVAIGPFNAHDRRIIHIALKEDLSLKTESLGEGEWKKIKIIPTRQEGE